MTPATGPTRAPVSIDIDGRQVRLTNLDKVLWPATGATKGMLVGYYATVADVLLPHLADRPLTLHRFPDGVEGDHWYETGAPAHPDWVRTQPMYTFRPGTDVHAPVVDGRAALLWAANTGAIELHPYLARTSDLRQPTAVVFDLDPGAPAGLVEAAELALAIRADLRGLGLDAVAKTSGGRGLHLFVPLAPGHTYDRTKAFARAVAQDHARRRPDAVVDVMARDRRIGKVFVDWSQNSAGKTTVAPYSLRGLRHPTASVPLRWAEVEAVVAARDARSIVFLAGDVLARVEQHGDLFAPALAGRHVLPDAA